MASFTAGGQDVICFATSRGKLCGLDLRSNEMVWELTNEAKYGMYVCKQQLTASYRAQPCDDVLVHNSPAFDVDESSGESRYCKCGTVLR